MNQYINWLEKVYDIPLTVINRDLPRTLTLKNKNEKLIIKTTLKEFIDFIKETNIGKDSVTGYLEDNELMILKMRFK